MGKGVLGDRVPNAGNEVPSARSYATLTDEGASALGGPIACCCRSSCIGTAVWWPAEQFVPRSRGSFYDFCRCFSFGKSLLLLFVRLMFWPEEICSASASFVCVSINLRKLSKAVAACCKC